ncbi:biopolymer transporter ExbD [Phaeodactylibacter sp.]|jgi:biopolymer transport protein ExbD|uniref:ExbD/TolR family protein n=1 Tax=Phaeodactylibacter sp. TaxID=1940289 RepID=UPI0025D5F260|nr:biopolymer transporter ExbD [Phaeodactylibacter sp.]MCI4651294.1 biopolymer transporter ExbD [Phaeodactylibacter sp.]MCI5092479.1 biopolymer transporter ExbD [Phaeodactylibacter sp.]
MGIKKRSKVSAEFSMSSLTDIIFLLLIFFMLTSSLVAPNALNLKLPSSSRSSSPSSSQVEDVRISRSGNYFLDNRRRSLGDMEKEIRRISRSSKPSITISPEEGTPTEHVVAIMDLAMRYKVNGVLATEKD